MPIKASEKLVEGMLREQKETDGAPARRPRIIRIFKDYKVFLNTVNSACEQLRDSGLNVSVRQEEIEDGVEMVIRVTQQRL